MGNRLQRLSANVQPENPIEAGALARIKGQGLAQGDWIIKEFAAGSAMRDIHEEEILEMIEPTKEIVEDVVVEFVIPGQPELKTEVVQRIHRVPMSPLEVAELHRKKYEELKALYAPEEEPQPEVVVKKAPKKKAAKTKGTK